MTAANAPVLVVDDEPGVRRMLVFCLARLGWRAEAVAGGREALARAQGGSHALVICDSSLEEEEGAGLLAALKALRPGMAQILMSGSYGDGAAGPWVFLRKPFRLTELEDAIRAALGGARADSGPAPPSDRPS